MTDTPDLPSIEELELLCSSPPEADREELLQEFLVAAAYGGGPMVAVVDTWLLGLADRTFVDGHLDASGMS